MQDSYVVCRIFQKNGPGPQNGAQYGAPFVEEEWDQLTAESNGVLMMGGHLEDEESNEVTEPEFLQMADLLQVGIWLILLFYSYELVISLFFPLRTLLSKHS